MDRSEWKLRGRAARLAKITKKTPTASRKWVKGLSIPSQAELKVIAKELGVDPATLQYGEQRLGNPVRYATADDNSVAQFVNIRIGAGAGRENAINDQINTTPFPFMKSFLDRIGVMPEDCRVLMASGESMEPTICDGDAMLVHMKVDNLLDGEIYVFTHEGDEKVKRVKRNLDKSVTLISDNPSAMYPNEVVSVDSLEELVVFGHVRWSGGER